MNFSRLFSALLITASFIATVVGQDAIAEEANPPRTELAAGDAAPDFKLKTIGDKPVVLSERFGEKGRPVILLFSRANW